MEQLNEALALLITQATTGIDTSVDFLQAQLPDVVMQLLMWHGVKSGVYCAVALLLLTTLAIVWRSVGKSLMTEGGFLYAEVELTAMALLASGAALGVPALSMLNLTWLQIWIAPKVWLIEYAANLIK